jgi:hypothetical protein
MIAQFLLIGDFILIIILTLKFIGGILKNIILFFAMTIMIMFIVYIISNYK